MGLRVALLSVLISTPQTGVDSILVSSAFLGWPFALFKVFATLFVMGVLGGSFVEVLEDPTEDEQFHAKTEKKVKLGRMPLSMEFN